MAVPSIDASANATATSSTVTVNLTTTQTNDYIMVHIETNGGPITSVTGGTLGAFTPYSSPGGGAGGNNIEVWAKFSSAALTTEAIVVNATNSAFLSANAVGVRDTGQTSLVFDAGGPQVSGGPDPIAMTNTTANCMFIAAFRMNSTPSPTAGSGWTQITGANFMLTEWKAVSATGTQTATITTGVGDSNGAVIYGITYINAAAAVTGADSNMFLMGVG